MIRRTVLAALIFGVAAVVTAAPAQADPHQICLVYDEERNGICVEIGESLPR